MGQKRVKYLAWIDLETTGLDPVLDPILEVGMVITSKVAPFEEIAHYSAAIEPDPTDHPQWRGRLGTYVTNMHTSNGLLGEIAAGATKSPERVQKDMEVVLAGIGEREQFMLAGSGVGHFDVKFLQAQMPEFSVWLHHTIMDVGMIRRAITFAGRKDLDNFGATFGSKGGKPHRGLEDVRDHLNEFRAYCDLFQQIPGGAPR